MDGGILMLVTCDAFERASDSRITAESELSRDEELMMLAAGDGGRDARTDTAAGEQRPSRGSRAVSSGICCSVRGV